MKHRIVIKVKNGRVEHIQCSGDTEIVLIEEGANMKAISKLEPDYIFELGKAHEAYMGRNKQFLKELKF